MTVVSQEEWLAARKDLLVKEKEFTRQRDALSAERRKLPWVRVEKEYVFDAPEEKQTLAELFAGRSQLIVYHFMLGPGWAEGCPSCSLLGDHFDGSVVHLAHRDVTLLPVSRAPLPQIEAFKRRMGWRFKWVSSYQSDFNRDYDVSFTKDELASGRVYYNLRNDQVSKRGSSGRQRVLQGRERRHLPHLFQLCARTRHLDWRVQFLGSGAKGTRRRGFER
jgi:predicted dithiol-disulfide oxidoreductase (DUF899 family)